MIALWLSFLLAFPPSVALGAELVVPHPTGASQGCHRDTCKDEEDGASVLQLQPARPPRKPAALLAAKEESNRHTEDALSNVEVDVGDLVFDGVECNRAGSAGSVLLLHGYPESVSIYTDLMKQLCARGFWSVAYNQRGYSPRASPSDVSDYYYDRLREDVWNVADKMGMDKFHLVTHDHGAVLGWYTAGTPQGAARILTFTALSIPHPNAFATALYGPESDPQQQAASSYFLDFVNPESASFLWKVMRTRTHPPGFFDSASAYQKALWWYNGAFAAGVLAVPPRLSAFELIKRGFGFQALLRRKFGGSLDEGRWPSEGRPQTNPSGDLTMPVLYAIGTKDTVIFGTRPWAQKTKDFCRGGYTYLEVDGGDHDLPGNPATCSGCGALYDAIITHVSQ